MLCIIEGESYNNRLRNHKHMRKALVTAVLLLLGVLPGQAQDNPWTAWLYTPDGSLTYVTDIGSVLQQVTLPLLQGQQYPPRVAVSRNGQYIAYVGSNPTLNADRLVIYNPTTAEILSDYIATDVLQHSIALYSSPLIFNADDSALAFSVALRGGGWRIVVQNTFGGVGAELTSDNPAVTTLNIPISMGMIPVIRRYEGAEVAFVMLRVDDPAAVFGSYLWNIESGAVSENTLYPGFDSAVFPLTGEIVAPSFDSAMPNNSGAFLDGQRNIMQAYLPDEGSVIPFYNEPNATLSQPHFIQNGELILVRAEDAAGNGIWRVLSRGGAVVGDLPIQIEQIIGMGDGFLYLTGENPPALMYVNTRDGLDAGLLMGQGTPNTAVQLAWAKTVLPGDAPLPSVTAWVNLSDQVAMAVATQNAIEVQVNLPTDPPQPVAIAPTQPPTPDFYVAPTPEFLPTRSSFTTQLAVGMRAVVVPDGHAAGLHTEPLPDAPAIILLYTDMTVDVLEGPNITGGYIWWRVRTTRDDKVGWAIEGANGETWLAPLPTDGG